ncbi:MAG TPA: hypothetical protein PK048_03565, partial [Candidatus Absconditabacterales bacterium]|nr:hypothetical protein [Candidatus Absconditabacterales bacterium]
CSNQCIIKTGDRLDLTLHDPISCGNPFVGTTNTNAPINLVSVTLYLSQQGSLKKTISLVPGSTSYSIRVNQGINHVEPGVYDVELIGTVGSITKTLTLNGVSIQHSCPQDPPYHDNPIHSGAIIQPTEEKSRYNQIIETIFPKHILPKTGAY